jgi:nitronate monooxygenase
LYGALILPLPSILQNRLSVPVIGSPLFIISNPDLVIAQCKAGIVGSFPALNARPVEVLEEWLQRITGELDAYNQANPDKPAAPFAVNQIVHKSNDRLMQDVELCVKYKVPIIITGPVPVWFRLPVSFTRPLFQTREGSCRLT